MQDEEWTDLLRETWMMLWRISVSILRNKTDAQDAVQQGMMKAWGTRARVRDGCERAWLTRIVINECHNILRQRARVTPVEQMDDMPYTPPDTRLGDAMAKLPEKLRLPLLLKYMEGMTEQEAARALRISVPSLKGRLYRARKELKRLLDEEVSM